MKYIVVAVVVYWWANDPSTHYVSVFNRDEEQRIEDFTAYLTKSRFVYKIHYKDVDV